jgi:hypothetical protein
MKIRTLVSNQPCFGLEPLLFRRGAGRALARVARLQPEQARVNAQTLREDFRLEPAAGEALLHALVAGGLLQPEPGRASDYRLTERFHEFALARVVPPLRRAYAKQLLEQACGLAAQINADWTRNPFLVDMVAVSSSYMRRSNKVADLILWPVVKARSQLRVRRFRPSLTEADGVSEIHAALRALSSYILVYIVTDTDPIERPFSVPFRADEDMEVSSRPMARFWGWSSSIRRQLTGS